MTEQFYPILNKNKVILFLKYSLYLFFYLIPVFLFVYLCFAGAINL